MAKILIVDDEETVLKLYSTILGRAGYQVVTASGSRKGFEMAVSAQPDLILLDVMMPDIDGAETRSKLSEHENTRHIPVIFLTSLLKEEEVTDAAGEIGGHEFLSKSTPHAGIVVRVQDVLAAAHAKAAAGAPD
jgi:CheY-like chemotaxis protein